MRNYSIKLPIFVMLMALIPRPSIAAVLYQTGFDPPTFAPGLLVGQDGWSAIDGLSVDAATVQTEVFDSAPNSVMVEGSQLERLDIPEFPELIVYLGSYSRSVTYDPLANNKPIVELSVNARMEVIPSIPFGPGVALLDPSSAGFGFISIDFVDGQGFVGLGNEDGVDILGPSYSVGEWANLRAVYDFQNEKVDGYFNNVHFGQIDFSSGVTQQISAVDMFVGALDQQPNIDAYFDDLSLRVVHEVPEPSTILGTLAAFGIGAAMKRKALP